MSRPLRIEYSGAWYHVMNRGRRREDFFKEKRDYETFIDFLKELADGYNVGGKSTLDPLPFRAGKSCAASLCIFYQPVMRSVSCKESA